MKALIITYYWPPAGGSGVQRWLKFVKYLPQFNITPVVFIPEGAGYPVIDRSLIDEVAKDLEILKLSIKEPNSILSFFGGKKRKTSAGFLDPNPSFFGKVIQYVRANYFIPDSRKFWIKPSVKYLSKYLVNNKVDVIITTGPPHSLHIIGFKVKKLLNISWIADFRDPWTDIDYIYQLPLTRYSLKKHEELEQAVLKNADAVLVVSNEMKKKYIEHNKNINVITNGFDDVVNDTKPKLDTSFSIVHIGMMNADRNPKKLWKVLNEIILENQSFAKDLKLKLIGEIADMVIADIKRFNMSSHLEVIQYLPHNESVKHQKSAQVLLLAVNNVPKAKGITTGKVFEYLQSKRPILAIAPTDGDLAEIINSTNSGKVVDFDDEINLKKFILEMYKDFKENSLQVHSTNIEQYHRRNLTGQLVSVIKKFN